ncbi:MAG TPA: TolC family protein [Vicinamibacteria bacterium]|nr:TolC family protein [Vicinamibacteria bacterium]
MPSREATLRWLLGGLSSVLVAAGAARAEERPLSLAEALAMAERQNPEVRAVFDRAEAQAARAEGVRRSTWPRLSLASRWARSDNPAAVFAARLNSSEFREADFAIDRLNAPSALSHQMTTLTLEAPLDPFGRVRTMADGQAALGRAADAGAREAVRELRLRVTEAYRHAELAGRAVRVTARALEGARAREAEVQARVGEGAALPADGLRARARRRRREADLAERRGEARVALAALGRLLGARAGEAFTPTEAPPAPVPLEGEEAGWTARALRQRPVLEAARHRREAGDAFARGERRSLLPEVAALVQVQDDRIAFADGGQSWAVGAQVRWTPFDGTRGRRVAAAEAESRAARQDERAAADQVRLEVETAFRRAEVARERYEAAAGGAMEGREALRVMQERRQAGLATLTDELETEAASLAAELEELRAATEIALADVALRRAAGEE